MTSVPSSVVELLQQLIAIPSVNPADDPGTDGVGEEAIASHIAGFLEACGAEATLEEVEPGRPNVVGRFSTEGGSKPRICLAPHTDTVSVLNMTIDPFDPVVRDGRVHGRGSCDTKGPMAAMLWALHELRDAIPTLDYEIVFAGLMGEEAGQQGSRAFAARNAGKIDFALVGEPTRLGVAHAHRGAYWGELTTTGVAAHASTPHLGKNAIVSMARAILALESGLAERLPAFSDESLGAPSFNLGICRGGSKVNIVPDECRLQIDIRTTPALAEHGTGRLIRGILAQEGLGGELRCGLQCSPLGTDPDNPFVEKLVSLGYERAIAPWFCDAAIFAENGIPAVAAGPGCDSKAHTADEWIEVDALRRGVDFYRAFLQSTAPAP